MMLKEKLLFSFSDATWWRTEEVPLMQTVAQPDAGSSRQNDPISLPAFMTEEL